MTAEPLEGGLKWIVGRLRADTGYSESVKKSPLSNLLVFPARVVHAIVFYKKANIFSETILTQRHDLGSFGHRKNDEVNYVFVSDAPNVRE